MDMSISDQAVTCNMHPGGGPYPHSHRQAMGAKASKKIKKLPKEDLEYLRANTNYSVDTIIEWYKGFMEDCPDGKLTPESFMHIYGNSFLTGNAKEFCDHVFRTFDKDKNGFIDFKEFLLAIHVTSSGTPQDKLNWAFR